VSDAVQPTPLLLDLAERIGAVSPAWREELGFDLEHAEERTTGYALERGVALGVEAIREGWLLHHERSRLLPEAGGDLRLLVGDWCYAAGLCEVSEHGTLDQVRVLAALVADISARAAEADDALESRWDDALAALDSMSQPRL